MNRMLLNLRRGICAAALAPLALSAVPALAQSSGPTAVPTSPLPAANRLDPVAIQALKGMGDYLKSLKSFEVRTKATLEDVVDDTDMKLTFNVEGLYQVQRPNAFHIELKSDRQIRQYFYDGKNFTVNVPRRNFYATVGAPSTIRAVVQDIYDQYGIALPLADLFYWSDRGAPTDGLTGAIRIGYAKVNGVDTDQFFYRGPDLDFQIWIQRGSQPLPRRMVITTRSSAAKPSYSADLDWNTAPGFTSANFAFSPDAKSTAIQMARVSPEEQ